MRTMRMVLLAGVVSAACAAFAQKAAVVEAVQFPAWLERGGQAVPLTPGTVLQPQDRLRTGTNARAQLKLPEGSTVKLGEQAQFVFDRSEDRNVFRATLQVLSGAFRFTTDALLKSQRRDVTIKVKNVTAGIRGTDLWGKSTGERDLVCLIEGKISVGSEGHPNVTLDQPLDFYQRPVGGAPSVAKVDEKQLAQWAQETELSKDGPGARAGGAWRVSAAAYKTRDEALAMNRKLRASGYPSEIVTADGIFSVRIAGLAGENEAHALLASLRSVPGITLPAVVPPGK
jgi:FecR-like protein/sporulation related protein